MATVLPPPIPVRPTDRLETWDEYCVRRSFVTLHRSCNDELMQFVRGFKPTHFPGVYAKLPEWLFKSLPLRKVLNFHTEVLNFHTQSKFSFNVQRREE